MDKFRNPGAFSSIAFIFLFITTFGGWADAHADDIQVWSDLFTPHVIFSLISSIGVAMGNWLLPSPIKR